MKAIVLNRIGHPLDVLEMADIPEPEVKEGTVLVRMVSSSINPGDFLFTQNLYPAPKRPVFPQQVAGNHGAGIVIKTGKGVVIPAGSFVAFSYADTWAEQAVIPAEWLIPLPADYPVEKAAQLVNLITGWDLVEASGAKAGDWLAITAAHSAVSVIAAQFAHRKGINTILITRKKSSGIDLGKTNAAAILDLSSGNIIKEQLQQLTAGKGLKAVIDNVGGPVTGELIRSMAFGSRLVINGGMSRERYDVHNLDILLSGLVISSYVYRYFFAPPPPSDNAWLQELVQVTAGDDFYIPFGGFNTLDDFKEAIAGSEKPGTGKRIFTISAV